MIWQKVMNFLFGHGEPTEIIKSQELKEAMDWQIWPMADQIIGFNETMSLTELLHIRIHAIVIIGQNGGNQQNNLNQ